MSIQQRNGRHHDVIGFLRQGVNVRTAQLDAKNGDSQQSGRARASYKLPNAVEGRSQRIYVVSHSNVLSRMRFEVLEENSTNIIMA